MRHTTTLRCTPCSRRLLGDGVCIVDLVYRCWCTILPSIVHLLLRRFHSLIPLLSPDLLGALSGHVDRVWCVRWSPCGRLLASASGDRSIRIWRRSNPSQHSRDTDTAPHRGQAEEAEEEVQWAAADAEWAVYCASTGSSVPSSAVSSPSSSLSAGSASASVVCASVLSGVHSRTVRCVAWSPDGSLLASAGFDGRVAVWRRTPRQRGRGQAEGDEEWEAVCVLEGHEHEVKAVSWSSDGRLLASCSRDKSVWVWERAEDSRLEGGGVKGDAQLRGGGGGGGGAAVSPVRFECAAVCQGHTGDVKWVSFATSRGRPLLLSAAYDDDIRLWTPEQEDSRGGGGGGEEWECIDTLRGHHSTVWMAIWVQLRNQGGGGEGRSVGASGAVEDADCIISASDDRTLRVWTQRGAGAATAADAEAAMRVNGGSRGEEAKEEEKAPRASTAAAADLDGSSSHPSADDEHSRPWMCSLTLHSPHSRTIFAIDLSPQQSNLSCRTHRTHCSHPLVR